MSAWHTTGQPGSTLTFPLWCKHWWWERKWICWRVRTMIRVQIWTSLDYQDQRDCCDSTHHHHVSVLALPHHKVWIIDQLNITFSHFILIFTESRTSTVKDKLLSQQDCSWWGWIVLLTAPPGSTESSSSRPFSASSSSQFSTPRTRMLTGTTGLHNPTFSAWQSTSSFHSSGLVLTVRWGIL